jgi:preprotein translocase subunit SecB
VSEPRDLPFSGYALLTVYTPAQELRHKESGDPNTHGAMNLAWDWRFMDENVFEVRIAVSIEPSRDRSDFVSVHIVGRFKKVGDSPALTLSDFARIQAVAILLPYARQALSSLTSNTLSGAYYLPPVNVFKLMEPFDAALATGAKQLESGEIERRRVLPAGTKHGLAKGSRKAASRQTGRAASHK